MSNDGRRVKVIPMFCHKWSCPRCGKQKARLWAHIAMTGQAQRFITLTYKPDPGATAYDMAVKLKKAFAKLVPRIRRKWGTFEYLTVWELTKTGTPHLHVLQRGDYIPQKWLSEVWHKLTGAFIVDIRSVRNPHEVAKYMMKYLSKEIGGTHAELAPLRLVQRSKKWVVEEEPEDETPEVESEKVGYTWFFCRRDLFETCEILEQRFHLTLCDDSDDKCLAFKAGSDPPDPDAIWFALQETIGDWKDMEYNQYPEPDPGF